MLPKVLIDGDAPHGTILGSAGFVSGEKPSEGRGEEEVREGIF